MTKSINDSIFEAMLGSAFFEYMEEETEKIPSDAELAERFPLPKKEEKWINRRIKERKCNRHRSLTMIYAQRAAIVFLVFVSLSFCLLSTSTKVRAAIKDTVIEWFEKYVRFDFNFSGGTHDTKGARSADSYHIGYIPKSFVLTESIEKINFRYYAYTDAEDNYLVIEISKFGDSAFMVDIEHNKYEEILLGDQKAYLLYNEEYPSGTIVWTDGDNTFCVDGLVGRDELIKISENIK